MKTKNGRKHTKRSFDNYHYGHPPDTKNQAPKSKVKTHAFPEMPFSNKRPSTSIKQKLADPIPGGFSSIKMNWGNKRVDFPKNVASTIKYRQIQPQKITATAGAQGVSEVLAICTTTQLLTSTAPAVGGGNLTAPSLYQSADGYFKLNPNEKSTGGEIFPQETVPVVDFLHITYVTAEIDLQNQSNVPCELILFGYEVKKNNASGPANTMQTGSIDMRLGTTDASGTTAGYALAPTAGNIQYTTPGVMPGSFNIWRQNYGAKDTKYIKLAAGEWKKISIRIAVHRTYSKEIVTQLAGSGTLFMRNATFGIMSILRGNVVNDITGGADTPTYGAAQVGMVVNTCFNLHFFSQASKKQPGYQTIVGVSAPTLANSKLQNEATGVESAQDEVV